MSHPESAKVIDLASIKAACKQCMLHRLCLPVGMDGSDLERLEQIIQRARPLRRADYLFKQGARFHSIYAVRSGSLKTYTITGDGHEQVTGFYLPGELVGLDAIVSERHPCSAVTLETTSCCQIPFDQLEQLAGTLPSLRHQLLRLMSKEIMQDQRLLLLLGKKSAEERLATLLLSLSLRFEQRGFSGREFNLSMSRADIGNYLGLAVETVSRLFTRGREQGLLEVAGKRVRLLDTDSLRKLAGGCGADSGEHPHKA